jgi:C4-dicarboxylate-specific signal transduction histidine kinase
MERAIAQRDREIREARATLEQKVNERTAELRRAQEALLVSNRFAAMGKTAAAIAHELKNTLNGLGVSIDLLTQGQLPRERGDAIRVQVRGEIARLRDISDNLNLFGAAPRLALGATDLHQLLERSLSLLSAQILAEDVLILREYHAGGAPLWISCDATKIQTAILNLCKNALEAMEPASFGDPFDAAPETRPRRLRIQTTAEKSRVLVQISDTGAGFSQEARAHLFEPFFTTKRTGTGLGLTIAQRLIEAHGGELSARDEVDGGTSFCLWLPIEPDLSRGATSQASSATSSQLPPRQIH